MTFYSDYDFYKDSWKGELSEEEYNRFVIQANSEIVARTLGRTSPDMEEALKMCECEIVDVVANYAKLQANGGVASVNNDGYSVSFEDSANVASSYNREITEICSRRLTFPVNLMLRWR